MHESKYLYKKILKIHHRANTPIPIVISMFIHSNGCLVLLVHL